MVVPRCLVIAWTFLLRSSLKHILLTTLLFSQTATLHLDRNSFVETIPTETGFLTKLSRLHLSQNQLTGTIPSELGLATTLGA